MPKRQGDLIGGVSRRDAEKAITFLRCLNPEILTLPPRRLFNLKQWSDINGFSEKDYFKTGHSSWWYLRNKILKWQEDGSDASGVTINDQEDESVDSTPTAETGGDDDRSGKGKGGRKGKATELANYTTLHLDDDEEDMADSVPMVERVIEFVDLEPIEIKDEDQFEVDWRVLELHEERVDA